MHTLIYFMNVATEIDLKFHKLHSFLYNLFLLLADAFVFFVFVFSSL